MGADHRGFEMKEKIKSWLLENEYEVEDVGARYLDPEDDYVDYALKVAESIEGSDGGSRGILLCGSGHGVDMVANRFGNVRAILGFNNEVTVQGREDEDANILVLPSDWVEESDVFERVRIFIETEKSDADRHVRRRARLSNLAIRQS